MCQNTLSFTSFQIIMRRKLERMSSFEVRDGGEGCKCRRFEVRIAVLPAAVAFLNGHVLMTSGRDACSGAKRSDKVRIRSQIHIL